MRHVVDKLRGAGTRRILLTERGTSFGYNNLVVDLRGAPQTAGAGRPRSSTTSPTPAAARGRRRRDGRPGRVRRAARVGRRRGRLDGVFLEVHEEPARALSDGETPFASTRSSRCCAGSWRMRGQPSAAQSTVGMTMPCTPSRTRGSPMIDLAPRVLDDRSGGHRRASPRLDGAFERAVDLLVSCRGRVVVTGIGKSGHVGAQDRGDARRTGTPAVFMHPAEALHGDLGASLQTTSRRALVRRRDARAAAAARDEPAPRRAAMVLTGHPSRRSAERPTSRSTQRRRRSLSADSCPRRARPPPWRSATRSPSPSCPTRASARRTSPRLHPGGGLGRG